MIADKRHRSIKVPQDSRLCPTHIDNKKKQVFEKNLFKCVTRPDLTGVPLTLLESWSHLHFITCHVRVTWWCHLYVSHKDRSFTVGTNICQKQFVVNTSCTVRKSDCSQNGAFEVLVCPIHTSELNTINDMRYKSENVSSFRKPYQQQ